MFYLNFDGLERSDGPRAAADFGGDFIGPLVALDGERLATKRPSSVGCANSWLRNGSRSCLTSLVRGAAFSTCSLQGCRTVRWGTPVLWTAVWWRLSPIDN